MNKSDFFKQTGKAFFFDDPFEIGKYALRHFPGDCGALVRSADDVADQRFLFNLRWDMERTHEPVVFDGDIDWLYQPGDDPEWIFAFNRMRFWICLGQAYALTRDEKYPRAFVKQLRGWVETVRPDDPKCAQAWRSIEVGLRLEYWLKAIRYFESSPEVGGEIVALFCESVHEHARFLMNIWNWYQLTSNWGVLGNHGLFMAGAMLPASAQADEYAREAAKRLSLEIRMQVYRDGTHWEQSPMYHNEVLSCYLDVTQLAERCGITLPGNIARQVRDMLYFDLYSAKPNHHEICMGDSDDIDQRDLLARGAALFRDGLLKSRAGELPDFDALWDLGEAGLRVYEAIPAIPPQGTDKAFRDSGNFYFRDSWSENATFVHFHCGTLGAGHGHADKLHVDLFSRGEDVLIDSGRYSYVFSDHRVRFKELLAHNTLRVDAKDIYVCRDSWECHDLSRGVNRAFSSDGRYGYAEGGHLAYMDLGVFVNRRVIYLKPDIVILADEFYASGRHTYEQFFHFNNAGTPEGGGDRYTYRSSRVTAEMLLLAEGLSSSLRETEFSRHYNQIETNKTVASSFTGVGFTGAFTVIALGDAGCRRTLEAVKIPVTSSFKGTAFEAGQVEALDVRFGGSHFTIVVAHEEFASPTDAFDADGCVGFGGCVVFDRAAGETQIGTVLSW